MASSMQIQLSSASLFFQDTGTANSDSPSDTILFVHGFPLDHTMWRDQVQALSSSHRSLVPDLRGFGQSSAITGTVTMFQFADDLDELLSHLSVTTPITVCGLSMGGYVALEMWRRHPNRIGRLILCDTRAEADPAEVARGREMMANQVEQDGLAGVADNMIPKLISAESLSQNSEIEGRVRGVIDGAHPSAVAAAQRGMAARHDVQDHLAQISVPTLVICGENDVITPSDGMRRMSAAIPNATFVEIPTAGHLAPMEQPAKVNEAILSWLESDISRKS